VRRLCGAEHKGIPMSGAPIVHLQAPTLRCGAAICQCESYAAAANCEHARAVLTTDVVAQALDALVQARAALVTALHDPPTTPVARRVIARRIETAAAAIDKLRQHGGGQ
jgi:hypothetical protein